MELLRTSDILKTYEKLKSLGVTSLLLEAAPLYPKLECRLPTGSYKARGVASFFLEESNRKISRLDVLSAGNLALALASQCKSHEISCRAIVPQGISEIKKKGLIELGAQVCEEPFERIWEMVESKTKRTAPGFLHPFNPHLLLGYSTTAAELLEQLPSCDAVVIPYGLGGLAFSVIQGLRALGSMIPVYLCEIQEHAPFHRAAKSGAPSTGPRLKSFIEAMGTPVVIQEVFDSIKNDVKAVVEVNEAEVKAALLHLHHKHGIRVEGAAAATYAAALKVREMGHKHVVPLMTGSNISNSVFEGIVNGSP